MKKLLRQLACQLASPGTTLFLGEAFFRARGYRVGQQDAGTSKPTRILVVRLDEIGDVVLTSAFLRELRRTFPSARITLVVKPATSNVCELCPHIDELLTFDWSVSGRLPLLQRHMRTLALARKHLWQQRFDIAIVPRWDVDHYHTAFVAYLSGAPRRLGYSERVTDQKGLLNAGFDRLFTDLLDDRTPKHEVEHNLDVVRFLGGQVQDAALELWLSEKDEAVAGEILRRHGVRPKDTLIAFGPGAGLPRKMWPLQNFVELGRRLGGDEQFRILVVGGPEVAPLGDAIGKELGSAVINAAGRTTLRETAALLKRSGLYVGNDSGPMHLAAAAGVPVVEICCHPKNGPQLHWNSPLRFGPWGVRHVVLEPDSVKPPCIETCLANEAHCIADIDVARVEEAVSSFIARVPHVALRLGAQYAD